MKEKENIKRGLLRMIDIWYNSPPNENQQKDTKQ